MAYENWDVWILFATWTDVTAYVETIRGPIDLGSGETPETTTDTGNLTLVLQNSDQRFTPGNVLSPYAPYVTSARQIRVTETIAGQEYELFTGYLEWPEIESWAASSTTAPRDQVITVSAVDLLGRFERYPAWGSTLSAHILSADSADDLVVYYPMGDPGPQANGAAFGAQPPLVVVDTYPGDILVGEVIQWQQDAAPGDDLAVASWTRNDVVQNTISSLGCTLSTPVTVAAGETVTLAVWVKLGSQPSFDGRFTYAAYVNSSVELPLVEMYLYFTQQAVGGHLIGGSVLFDDGGSVLLVDLGTTGAVLPVDVWTLVTMQITLSLTANAQILTVGSTAYTATASGSVPTSVSMDVIQKVGEQWLGGMGYLQIYTGAAPDYAAQYEAGMYGLERQTTGERIRTVLRYAVPDADLTGIDDGTSVMQRADLGGQTPLTALQAAVTTEQGSLYIDGSGRTVFEDRRTLYNV